MNVVYSMALLVDLFRFLAKVVFKRIVLFDG